MKLHSHPIHPHMSAVMDSSNERLSNIFEMLVNRMDNLENNVGSLHDLLTMQATAARHADSLCPLRIPFSGLAMTGHCVTLEVDSTFDAEGCFINAHGGIKHSRDVDLFGQDIMWVGDTDIEPWVWDDAVRVAWGIEKFELVRAKMAA